MRVGAHDFYTGCFAYCFTLLFFAGLRSSVEPFEGRPQMT